MSGLAAFLLARIAEDEAGAAKLNRFRLEHPEIHERWAVRRNEDRLMIEASPASGIRKTFVLDMHHLANDDLVDHIARWDPARVLAECAAKRRIVERWQSTNEDDRVLNEYAHNIREGSQTSLYFAMKALALPFADHDDYRAEWKP